MSATAKGWPFPADTERPDVPLWVRQLAETADRRVARVHTGTQRVTLNNSTWGEVVIDTTFMGGGTAWNVIPVAFHSGGNFMASVMFKTPTSCRVRVTHVLGVASNSVVDVDYVIVAQNGAFTPW
jgi:hypothetical protein